MVYSSGNNSAKTSSALFWYNNESHSSTPNLNPLLINIPAEYNFVGNRTTIILIITCQDAKSLLSVIQLTQAINGA